MFICFNRRKGRIVFRGEYADRYGITLGEEKGFWRGVA